MHALTRSLIVAGVVLVVPRATVHAQEEVGTVMRAEREGERVVLDGVDRYQVCEPLFEGVRVVLSHRGEQYSAEYIQGISGAAFRIAGICPCAPTSSSAMWTADLPSLLGYDVKHITLEACGATWKQLGELAKQFKPEQLANKDEPSAPELRQLRGHLVDMVSQVKANVRSGRPAILWNAFTTAEFDVVTGFDEARGELMGRGTYVGTGEGHATAKQFRTLRAAFVGGWPAAILIGEKKGTFDSRKAEEAALREAVRHAHSTKNHDKLAGKDWVLLEGLSCYDRWVKDFGKPDKKRTSGDAYCYSVYRSTHRAAAGFLREIAPKYPAARVHLEQAAGHFQAEADALKQAETLLSRKSPEGPDPERNQKAAEILARARDEYAAGIRAIEKALTVIDEKNETAGSVALPKKD